jgi:hypothetical protein
VAPPRPALRVAVPLAPLQDRLVPLVAAIEALAAPLVLGARLGIVLRDRRVVIGTIEIGRRALR